MGCTPCQAGFFGKVPSLGDFVSRRLPRSFIDSWDEWLQSSLAASREQLGSGWLDIYLTSPLWRFALSPGVCGPEAWAGVLMPSVDRVGRYFPLTLATPLADGRQVVQVFEAGSEWFDEQEQLALSALEDGFDLAEFDRALQALELPTIEAPVSRPLAGPVQGRFAFHLGIGEVERMPAALVGLCGALLDRFLPAHTLWGTAGSEQVDASLVVCEGLPPVSGYAALMTGDWEQANWAMQSREMPAAPIPAAPVPETPAAPPPALDETDATKPPAGIWTSHGISVVGHHRKINEDALLERPDIGLWVVADGMGGHHAGEFASGSIVEGLAKLGAPCGLDHQVSQVSQCLEDINGCLRRLANDDAEGGTVGSTVVALLAEGHRCAVLWAGDSRLYRERGGKLEQLTHDHSLLDELLRSGVLSPEQTSETANGNIITRAIGADETLELDVTRFEAEDGDTYLLCSDGLYKELSDDSIAPAMRLESCEAGACALIDAALANGGRDNISVVLIRVGSTS